MGAAVILSDVALTSRSNQTWAFSGLDTFEQCIDQQHFSSYPHNISYVYNSRGFRDCEWPTTVDELSEAVWCIGDSFTVGVGSPLEFTWPQVLQHQLQRRCINVSMDGASNNWISRTASKIIKEIRPKTVVVLWSYFHRREHPDTQLLDEQRRLHCLGTSDHEDFINFQTCFFDLLEVCNLMHTQSIHATIPGAYRILDFDQLNESWNNIRDPSWPAAVPVSLSQFHALPQHIQTEIIKNHQVFDDYTLYYSVTDFVSTHQIFDVPQLDFARDHHHFDLKTSQHFVNYIVDQLTVG
jgi:hypothetical protein